MESAFRLSAPVPRGTREYAPRYNAEEWDFVRPRIHQLYVTERATLEQVMRVLQDENGFCASEKQLKSRIAKWGFDVKNVRGDIMVQMARKRVKRMRDQGKKSVFLVGKQVVPARKINRYLKRNNVSEEELLSLPSPVDAPSPAFSVFTPRPKSLLDTGAEISHSETNIATACTRPAEWLPVDQSDAVTVTKSHPKRLGSGCYFPIPQNIRDRPESPEVLLWHFREQICPMLAMADGKNNMWQTLVLPLVHDSDTLYQAIAAMTTLYTSSVNDHQLHGALLMLRTIAKLNTELEGSMIGSATLATILILAYWARWNQGSNAGRIHVNGAVAALRLLQSRAPETNLRSVPDDKRALMALLSNTCVYMDGLSRLVNAATAIYSYKFSSETLLEENFGHPADPWMYCAGGLYPLMNRAADLCYAARTGDSHIFPVVFGDAVSLRLRLENWVPNKEFGANCRVHVSALDTEYITNTAEAFRYATILYLLQGFPDLPGACIKEVIREVFDHLSVVPSISTITFVQIFPLFVAGCEANEVEDRRWVQERWSVMIARMRVRNVSKCWEITQEVWRRRDLCRRLRRENVRCMVGGLEDNEEFMGMGKIHWAQVVKEWGWEVSF